MYSIGASKLYQKEALSAIKIKKKRVTYIQYVTL